MLHTKYRSISFKWIKNNTVNKLTIKIQLKWIHIAFFRSTGNLFIYDTKHLYIYFKSIQQWINPILGKVRANELIIMNYPHCYNMLMKWCSFVESSKCIMKMYTMQNMKRSKWKCKCWFGGVDSSYRIYQIYNPEMVEIDKVSVFISMDFEIILVVQI